MAVNEYNKRDGDFVIVDESSMVDIFLFDSLLKGLRVDTKIILVGDYNQLPSVGPGQLLRDIIDSGRVEVISLKKVYRQKEGSTIIDFAYQFNEGIIDEKIFKKSYDLTFVETRDMLRTSKMIASDYVSEDFAAQHKRIGRSWGCPAVPRTLAAPIINTIKGQNVLFIYYPDQNYLNSSEWLKS